MTNKKISNKIRIEQKKVANIDVKINHNNKQSLNSYFTVLNNC